MRGVQGARAQKPRTIMRTAWVLMLEEILLLAPFLVNFSQALLLPGRLSSRFMHQGKDYTRRLMSRDRVDCDGSSNKGLRELRAAADGEVVLKFKPSEVEVGCKPGEVVLDVGQRCAGMMEDTKNPFCRDGGCYNCEVEVVEALELGLEDNLVRACMFKVPEGAKQLTLIQMSSDEAFDGML